MATRLLDALAEAVTGRRWTMLAGVAVLAAAAAFGLPRLEADASPEDLVGTIENEAWAAEHLHAHFGDTDHAVLVLLEAPDGVVARPALDWLHATSRHFAAQRWVHRTDGLTTTPIAVRRDGPAEGDEDDAPTATLDDLEEEPEPQDPPEHLTDALGALVEAEPERFPNGLASVADELDSVEHGPPLAGETATAAEVQRLADALDRGGELVYGRLVSRDQTVVALVLWLGDDVRTQEEVTAAVRAVDARLASHPPPGRMHASAGGLPHLRTSIVDNMSRDQTLLVPLTLVVCMVLLFVSFRWWPAVVFPIVAVGVTALLVVGGMGLVGEELNILNNIIPPLLIIIGVSDSIHLIGRYREEVRAGEGAVAATSTTVRAMAVACLLTSVTTAVGLASLAVSNTPMLQRFGVTAAIGVMLAYVVTIAFLPATITFFRPPAQPGSDESASAGRFLENLVVGLTRAVIARPLAVLAGAAVLFGLALWSTTAVEVDTSLLDSFEEGDPAFDTTHLLEEKLDGIRPLEVILEAGGDTTFHEPELLAAVDHVSTWLREQPGVLRVTSASDWLHELWFLLTGDPAARDAGFRTRAQVQAFGTLMAERDPDPLAFYLSEDARIARIEVKMRDAGARAITDVVSGLETELDEAFAGTDVRAAMTGDAYTGSLGIATVVDDLLGSLTVAVLIIFAMLALLFRSVRLGLLSIPPNGLPLLCAVGWMVLRGIPLNIATAIIFSISIGLAVDGTIHVLARFREERTSGRDIDTSLLRAAAGTGRAIVVSSATLTLGFGVLLFSSFVPVRIFGELIAVTVASCLVATLVLQPALLKVGAPRDTGER